MNQRLKIIVLLYILAHLFYVKLVLWSCTSHLCVFVLHEVYPGRPYQDCEDTYFADLLERECLAVVKGSYFRDCMKDGKPFQDRANIPQEYFIPGKKVVALWKRYGARFLHIASYSWLSQTSVRL